jgi:hypothetical protein
MIKPILLGAGAGIVSGVAPSLPYIGKSYVPLAVGYLGKDNTIKTIGAYSLGLALAGNFTGGNGTTNNMFGGY